MAITSAFQADDAGSIPAARSKFVVYAKCFAHVAQLVEHTLGKGEVSGSNPLMSSTSTKADMQISAFVLMAVSVLNS